MGKERWGWQKISEGEISDVPADLVNMETPLLLLFCVSAPL